MSARSRGGGFRPLRTSLAEWTPGGGRAPDPLHAIAAAWPGIVGRDIAANAMPLDFSAKVLIVGTRSSAWSQQLQFLSLPILEGLRALPGGFIVERLAFRTGTLPRARQRRSSTTPAGAVVMTRPDLGNVAPAVSLEDAYLRLRARMSGLARSGLTCQDCGAAIEPQADLVPKRGAKAKPLRCAPCSGEAETSRRTAVERFVYMAPWLTLEDLRAELPDLGLAEFERARKTLLARWWTVLERARRSGRVSSGGIERHVGSSYVLLQSRLPPDRITPAVVRNLLGAELERLLWPHSTAAATDAPR